jgi:putative ABC transport system permease protein
MDLMEKYRAERDRLRAEIERNKTPTQRAKADEIRARRRLALGAAGSDVRNMVIFHGMRLTLVGVVIGLAFAFGLTRLIASFLFGVKTHDPVVFTAVPLILTAVAFVAVWIPARRASSIDPLNALRHE